MIASYTRVTPIMHVPKYKCTSLCPLNQALLQNSLQFRLGKQVTTDQAVLKQTDFSFPPTSPLTKHLATRFCGSAKFVAKIDDDITMDLPNLQSILHEKYAAAPLSDFIECPRSVLPFLPNYHQNHQCHHEYHPHDLHTSL